MAAQIGYVVKNLSHIQPEVRQAVVEAALRDEVTISDVIGAVLSQKWAIEYAPSGQKPTGVTTNGGSENIQMNIRVPQEMATRIWLVSRAEGLTESSLVQMVLAEHFGIEYEPVKRGGAVRRRR